MNKKDLRLTGFSVSLKVNETVTHEFINLHPHILAFFEVIPPDWLHEEEKQQIVLAPGFCSSTYENGVRISGSRESVKVSQAQDVELGGTYFPPVIAASYIYELALDVFHVANMDWEIEVPFDNPVNWTNHRFFQSEFIPSTWSNVETIPFISFEIQDTPMSLSFIPVEEEGAEDSLRILVRVYIFSSNDDDLAPQLLAYREFEDKAIKNLLDFLETRNG